MDSFSPIINRLAEILNEELLDPAAWEFGSDVVAREQTHLMDRAWVPNSSASILLWPICCRFLVTERAQFRVHPPSRATRIRRRLALKKHLLSRVEKLNKSLVTEVWCAVLNFHSRQPTPECTFDERQGKNNRIITTCIPFLLSTIKRRKLSWFGRLLT